MCMTYRLQLEMFFLLVTADVTGSMGWPKLPDRKWNTRSEEVVKSCHDAAVDQLLAHNSWLCLWKRSGIKWSPESDPLEPLNESRIILHDNHVRQRKRYVDVKYTDFFFCYAAYSFLINICSTLYVFVLSYFPSSCFLSLEAWAAFCFTLMLSFNFLFVSLPLLQSLS